ncbi:unnamed protein product [Heterobilharzia americana]|nr:unnamed protein product [Heterobilharzia americana]
MNALSNTAILSTSKTCSELSDISFITISEFSKIVRQSEKKQLSRNHVCCRICLQSSDSEELLSPCYCSGTIGIIHKHCLERWLNLSRSRTCEICGYKFKVLRRYPVFSEWLWSGGEGDGIHRRKHLWTDIICLLLMLPLLTLCTWLTISSSQEEIGINRRGFPWQSFSLGLLCSLLLLVFIIWLTFSVRYHHQSWRIWRIDQSCIVLAEDINKAKILDEKYDIEYQNVVVQSDIQEQITMPRSNEADLEHDQMKHRHI